MFGDEQDQDDHMNTDDQPQATGRRYQDADDEDDDDDDIEEEEADAGRKPKRQKVQKMPRFQARLLLTRPINSERGGRRLHVSLISRLRSRTKMRRMRMKTSMGTKASSILLPTRKAEEVGSTMHCWTDGATMKRTRRQNKLRKTLVGDMRELVCATMGT